VLQPKRREELRPWEHSVRSRGTRVGVGYRRLVLAHEAGKRAPARCLWAAHAEADSLAFRVNGDVTYDDNVNRGISSDRLHDAFANLEFAATFPLQLSPFTRLLLSGAFGGDGFIQYTGLDRAFAAFNGELQYRSSGQYTSPIYAVFVRQSWDRYESDLRDGFRTSAGVSVRKPITDRIFVFGALAYSQRHANSTVFDTEDVPVRGPDYAIARGHTLYMGLDYRDGDSVSTSLPSPALVDISEARVADDVFIGRNSYRFKARTGILTLGYNVTVGQGQALDLSYRGVYSKPKDQPPSSVTTGTIYYVDNQITLSYLIRF
jgi:hypothetical protein